MAEYRATTAPRPAEHEAPPLEFPGCRPVRISRAEIADYERRIEYWDAATEVAMVCEPVSVYHEQPGQLLAGLLKTIAHLRGSPIATFGAADLLLRRRRWRLAARPGGRPNRISAPAHDAARGCQNRSG